MLLALLFCPVLEVLAKATGPEKQKKHPDYKGRSKTLFQIALPCICKNLKKSNNKLLELEWVQWCGRTQDQSIKINQFLYISHKQSENETKKIMSLTVWHWIKTLEKINKRSIRLVNWKL